MIRSLESRWKQDLLIGGVVVNILREVIMVSVRQILCAQI